MSHTLALAVLAALIPVVVAPAAMPADSVGPADSAETGEAAGRNASSPAMPCSDYAEILDQLGDRYAEAPVSLGMQTNGNLLEVFASPKGGTWTILSLTPDGLACIVAAGRHWATAPPAPDDPEPAGSGV